MRCAVDGDGPCDSGSKKANGGTGGDYRYYASSVSTSGGASWRKMRMDGTPMPCDMEITSARARSAGGAAQPLS